jgi:small-conductance mechanosensitive channel
VDLYEKRQLDLAEHMARMNQHVANARAHARPWRAIISLILAIISGAVASYAGGLFKDWTGTGHYTAKLITAVSVVAFCVFATAAVVGLAGKAREVLTPAVGSSHAAIVRYAILLVGGVTALVMAVALMKVPVGQLLVGGAVTTILLGIAGQQSLSNVFAGLVLLLSRPFHVGDYIQLKSGALGGATEGLVAEVGITYLRLETEDGTLNLPNSQVLAAAVGPVPRPSPEAANGTPGAQPPGETPPAGSAPTAPPSSGGAPSGDAPGAQ